MDLVQDLNPERLSWCLRDTGISLEECALSTGISIEKLRLALGGEPALTVNQLKKLAALFGRGLLFFLDDAPVAANKVQSVQFRTLANQKPGLSPRMRQLIQRAERQRDIFVGLLDEVDHHSHTIFSPPQLHKEVRRAAGQARTWLGLTDRNCFDSYRSAVESKGILVFRSNGYAGSWQFDQEASVLGFALYDKNYPLIVVRKSQWEAQQSFTLMHELAHVLLDRKSSIDDTSDMESSAAEEQRANMFAGLLLVPDSHLAQIDDSERPSDASQYDEWLHHHRRDWGVSTEVLLRRLLDEGRLRKSDYLAYRAWSRSRVFPLKDGGNRGHRHREPRHLFGDRFVRLVFDALHARKITLNRASSFLDNIKVSDVHALDRYCASV